MCGTDTMCCNIEITPTNILSQFEVLDTSLVCEGSCVQFRETSNNYNYSNSIVKWWFDWDGTYPPTQSSDISVPFAYDTIVSHCYESAGAYLVLHEITGNGALGSPIDSSFNEFDTVYIYPSPDVQINNCVPICNLDTLIIENNTTINDSIDGMEHLPIIIDGYQWYIDGVAVNSSIINDNLIFTPTTPGVYEIVLEAWSTLGCMSSDTCQVIVYELPEADFFVVTDTICLGDTTVFRDNSINGDWSINTWIWDFGDSNTDTIINYIDATNSYYLSGDYLVGLTVIDGAGCSDTFEDTIYISPNINAFFTHDIVCEGQATTFDGTGSSSSTDIWRWDFDFDGDIDDSLTGPIVSHTFSNPGWHVVFLETWNILSTDTCRDFTTDSIYVYANPDVEFSADTACFGENTNFINLTQHSIDATSMLYQWEFIDTISGSVSVITSTDYEPSYEFEDPPGGWFTVNLTMTDTNNCSDTYTDSVLVAELPTAIVSDTSICNTATICFGGLNNSQDGTFPITQWQWTVPTGSFPAGGDTLEFPCITFNNFGNNQIITLQITDMNECSDNTSSLIDVYQNPIASIFVDSIAYKRCSGDSVRIIENGSTPSGAPIASYDWILNNATPNNISGVNEDTITILYPTNIGWQDINLTIIDTNGCRDDLLDSIYINSKPQADFTGNDICANEPLLVQDLSIPSSDGAINYPITWIYYDHLGNITPTSPTVDSFYNYNSIINEHDGAIVRVKIEVQDVNGCTDTLSKFFTIFPIPDVDFTTPTICEDDTVTFCNLTQYGNNLAVPYPGTNEVYWQFSTIDDSEEDSCWTLSTDGFPPNTYQVSLEVESNNYSINTGTYCKNSFTQPHIIVANPKIDSLSYSLSTDPGPACGTEIELNFESTHSDVSEYNYTFASYCPPTSATTDLLKDFVVTLGPTFNYQLELSLEHEQDGIVCTWDSSIFILTSPYPEVDFSTTGIFCEDEEICFFDESFITDTASPGYNYQYSLLQDDEPNNDEIIISYWQWDLGNGQYPDYDSTVCSTYDAVNGYTYTYFPILTVETSHGCRDTSDTIAYPITVNPAPDAKITQVFNNGVNEGQWVFDGTGSLTSGGVELNFEDYDFNWWINYLGYDAGFFVSTNPPDSVTYQFYQGNQEYWIYLEIVPDSFPLCISRDSFLIEVDYFKGLSVPNALAPNGNSGEPSYFLPKGISLQEYHLEIYDTWGNLVWQTREIDMLGRPSVPWRGTTIDDKPLPQGTYVWKIYARFKDGSVWPGKDGKITGPIYLIR